MALFVVALGLIGLSSLNILVVMVLGNPDWGAVLGGVLAQIVASAMYISVGLFASVSTREPIAAGLGGMVMLLPFWLVDLLIGSVESPMLREVLMDFSLVGHLQPMSKGLIDSVDVLWFVLMTTVFLWLTNLVLESKRWR
jgi:ABC-2 type transport system permease protein